MSTRSFQYIGIALALLFCISCLSQDKAADLDAVDSVKTNFAQEAGLDLSFAGSNITDENKTRAYALLSLRALPTDSVIVAVSSSDTGEGAIVGTNRFTFTPSNWNTKQIVVIEGVDDDALIDGDQNYTLTFDTLPTSDSRYNGLENQNLSLINKDNDIPSVIMTQSAGLTLEEAVVVRQTVSFRLSKQPTANTVISIAGNPHLVLRVGGTAVNPAVLTFTTVNWNTSQAITVEPTADTTVTGDQQFDLAVSANTSTAVEYRGLNLPDIPIRFIDADKPGFKVSYSTQHTSEDGAQAQVRLQTNTRIPADESILVQVSVSDQSEAMIRCNTADAFASTCLKRIDGSNTYNTATLHTIDVRGEDDDIVDGHIAYNLSYSVSSTGKYKGMSIAPSELTNIDNDTKGVRISALSAFPREGEDAVKVSMTLSHAPSSNVRIPLHMTSSDVRFSPQNTCVLGSCTDLTFTPLNWNTPQSVSIEAVDNSVPDGTRTFQLTLNALVSADPSYSGLVPDNLILSVLDNDKRSLQVAQQSTTTRENGTQATFSLVPNTAPLGNVRVSLAISDSSEALFANGTPAETVTFSAASHAATSFTLKGVDDTLTDGNQSFAVSYFIDATADSGFEDTPNGQILFTNIDDETPAVHWNARNLITSEAGGMSVIRVSLTAAPANTVTVGASFGTTAERVTVNGAATATLTFTPANWNQEQILTVRGADDGVADGNVEYILNLSTAASADATYAALANTAIYLVNQDESSGNLRATTYAASGERGTNSTVSFALSREPTASVTVAAAIPAEFADEGSITGATSFTFTTVNWNTPQSLTLARSANRLAQGISDFFIEFTLSSTDANFNKGGDTTRFHFINADPANNAGVLVATGLNTTMQRNTSQNIQLSLQAQPTGNVTLGIAIPAGQAHEASLLSTSLTFTTLNWNVLQTVRLTSSRSTAGKGSRPFSVIIDPSSTADRFYNRLPNTILHFTNTD